MKINRIQKCGLALAALLVGGACQSFALTPDFTWDTFHSNIGQTQNPWGAAVNAWDASQDSTGDGGGSWYITTPCDANNDTPLETCDFINPGNPW